MRVLRHLYVLAGAHPAVRCDVILLDCWPWPDHSLAAGRGVLLLHARHRQPLLLATATRRPRTRCRVGWGRRVRSGRGALGRWISIRAQGQVISRVRHRDQFSVAKPFLTAPETENFWFSGFFGIFRSENDLKFKFRFSTFSDRISVFSDRKILLVIGNCKISEEKLKILQHFV